MPAKHKFDENVENLLCKDLVDGEYSVGKRAKDADLLDFDAMIDMLECKRNEKDYEWMSDIFIPEFPSLILTDASGWANQYFKTRDFVEVKLEGNEPDDNKKCIAAKRTLNQTLNRRKLHHYIKYIRGRLINTLHSEVYALCWWEKKVNPKIIGYRDKAEELGVDIEGNEITSEDQIPATYTVQEPVMGKEIVFDHFNYDILHPANVVTDNKYCYSVQDKDWIYIRSETNYESLKAQEKSKGYFNLDLVKELQYPPETEESKETYNKDEGKPTSDKVVIKYFDRLMRFGKSWANIKSRTEDDYPLEITPGYDKDGEILEKAELVDTIMEFVVSGSSKILIRFQPNPYRDTKGESYKPIARGLCYIHPTKDSGLSDGKNIRELQVAINDNFNMGQDRVKLATLPTLKGKRLAIEDNSTIYFEPQHVMQLDNPDDLVEFKLSDNIEGSLKMQGMLASKGQQVMAIYPTTMGQLPEMASTTATAVAGAETRGNARENYKSLTHEYTFQLDQYWIILQMTYQFAEVETAMKMMGDVAQYYDPDADYAYSPVSSNIETQYNKHRKLQIIDQFIGRLVQFPNPNTTKLLNYLLSLSFEAFDKEFPEYKKYLLDERVSPQPEVGAGGGEQMGKLSAVPTTNQTGTPQSSQEQMTRAGWR
jgi:hypothetical protein